VRRRGSVSDVIQRGIINCPCLCRRRAFHAIRSWRGDAEIGLKIRTERTQETGRFLAASGELAERVGVLESDSAKPNDDKD